MKILITWLKPNILTFSLIFQTMVANLQAAPSPFEAEILALTPPTNYNSTELSPKFDPTKPKKIANKSTKSSGTSPTTTTVAPENELNLSLIIITASDKIAIINHQSLHENDHIAGLKIITIDETKVVLQQSPENLENNRSSYNNGVNGYIELNLPKKSKNYLHISGKNNAPKYP